MDIKMMHNIFRTLGQQMGLQRVRGILPESIDAYINASIINLVNTSLANAVTKELQQNVTGIVSTMSAINNFRTLHRVARFSIDDKTVGSTKKVSEYDSNSGYYVINIPTINSNIDIDTDEYKLAVMMFLSFSVEYENTPRGNAVGCRIVGSDEIEFTNQDYCNKADKSYPITCLESSAIVINNLEQLNARANEKLEIFTNTKDVHIKYLNIKYIKTPNIVRYDDDDSLCVNCDLPEYLHQSLVENAVQMFLASVGVVQPNVSRQ